MHRDFATSPDWKTDTNHMYEQSCFGYSIMKVMVACVEPALWNASVIGSWPASAPRPCGLDVAPVSGALR